MIVPVMPPLRPQLMVALFAPLGTLTRILLNLFEDYLIENDHSSTLSSLGHGYFFSNVLGCMAMSLVLYHRTSIVNFDTAVYVGLSTGYCGSLTTLSAWAQRASWLLVRGAVADALLVLLLTHCCCWVAMAFATTAWRKTKALEEEGESRYRARRTRAKHAAAAAEAAAAEAAAEPRRPSQPQPRRLLGRGRRRAVSRALSDADDGSWHRREERALGHASSSEEEHLRFLMRRIGQVLDAKPCQLPQEQRQEPLVVGGEIERGGKGSDFYAGGEAAELAKEGYVVTAAAAAPAAVLLNVEEEEEEAAAATDAATAAASEAGVAAAADADAGAAAAIDADAGAGAAADAGVAHGVEAYASETTWRRSVRAHVVALAEAYLAHCEEGHGDDDDDDDDDEEWGDGGLPGAAEAAPRARAQRAPPPRGREGRQRWLACAALAVPLACAGGAAAALATAGGPSGAGTAYAWGAALAGLALSPGGALLRYRWGLRNPPTLAALPAYTLAANLAACALAAGADALAMAALHHHPRGGEGGGSEGGGGQGRGAAAGAAVCAGVGLGLAGALSTVSTLMAEARAMPVQAPGAPEGRAGAHLALPVAYLGTTYGLAQLLLLCINLPVSLLLA